VPGDLSIVGFDDVPAAARAEPELTTVHQPHLQKGRVAAGRLVTALQGSGSGEPVTVILPTELVVRQSTAPPAAKLQT
jgi:DNA-binding LacI/PurR family transcriptional regulator